MVTKLPSSNSSQPTQGWYYISCFVSYDIQQMYFQEPLRLYGEGDYGLTVVKEMNGTVEFKNLDVETRDCELMESFLDCQARHYLLDGLAQCKCVPYALKNYSNPVHNSTMQGQVDSSCG